ncbi:MULTISPECIES: pur operon repressor [Bacillus]|jgi:purine operon repressor|uniref:Pur operon repressor n=10 Tax=Bacillus cereus group TaxID=86661 RepID=A0AAC8NAH2_BACAN|nr:MULTISPECIES: pur operon repressor [Bacillus]EDX54991.1 pur operon repressor [Bacillus cereus W]EDX65996.1 pur operon repressor [Bacillus cereus NVH0597-99]EFI64204.1 pur operon repressor [Bacillus cereus SJ1]EJT18464.1 pur operon repressor [Bacillus anthracis str. UR-1]EXJ22280.1 LacI family transcriptional regulator [Bacillus anthracis str. 95014]MDR4322133.1 pur operon repressor [Bacillus paranthracis]UBR30163.1 pur operon repressor [Bacillus sp. SD-4]COF44468.1 transcriptional regula
MKIRRSTRLVDMTYYLLQNPRQLVSLTFFAERYQSAKSSISEDLVIIKQTFEQQGVGTLQTIPGAAGGVKYIPYISEEEADLIIGELCSLFENPDRILPGGYLYMTDLLSNPRHINGAGRLFASVFARQPIDAVMTVATKGIPLAYAVANYLDVPVVIARKDNKVTEGPTVSINYVSGSSKRIQTMTLAKRSLPEGSNVLIIDDFMKAGGTIQGMMSMLEEFKANVVGIGVLVESTDIEERLINNFVSLIRLSEVDVKEKAIQVEKGNYSLAPFDEGIVEAE